MVAAPVGYRNPFNLLLTVLAAVSWLTEDIKATVVIGAMVLLSTLIRFVQEGPLQPCSRAAEALVGNTARVLRRNPRTEAADGRPVLGAHLHSRARRACWTCRLRTGARRPHRAVGRRHDSGRLPRLTAKDLFVAQAAMTGESLPVEKFAHPGDGLLACWNSTTCCSWAPMWCPALPPPLCWPPATTYFGTLALRSTATDRAPTAFQAGVNSVSWLLIRFALVMVPRAADQRLDQRRATGPKHSCSRRWRWA